MQLLVAEAVEPNLKVSCGCGDCPHLACMLHPFVFLGRRTLLGSVVALAREEGKRTRRRRRCEGGVQGGDDGRERKT